MARTLEVKDAAVGKVFIFITIVKRNAMGTLVRAAPGLVSMQTGLPKKCVSTNGSRKPSASEGGVDAVPRAISLIASGAVIA